MAETSKIEWTDSTFNPWIGCTKVSPGCEHCYAETQANFHGWSKWGKGQPRHRTSDALWRAPIKWNKQAASEGKRKRVFCASLADVFDAEVDPNWRLNLWELVRKTPFLDWLILTKRPQNFKSMLPDDWGEGWPNVCLMVSVEDQTRASRVPLLVETPAQFRALSVEPLLGPVTLKPEWLAKLDWVIVGGESGPGARPMHPQWARDVRDQCETADVKVFFKQWGCWTPDDRAKKDHLGNGAYFPNATIVKPTLLGQMKTKDRRAFYSENTTGTWLWHTSKTKAGNKLDGRTYRDHPFGKKIPANQIVVPLSSEERSRLKECETKIRKGLEAGFEMGMALTEIRDSQLYREKFDTFEEYVQHVHSFARSYAYHMMGSAEVVRDLSTIVDKNDLPKNEAQARVLVPLKTPEERIEAWQRVQKSAGDRPMTAKVISEIVFPEKHSRKDGAKDTKAKIREQVAKLRKLFADTDAAEEAETLLKQLEKLKFLKLAGASHH